MQNQNLPFMYLFAGLVGLVIGVGVASYSVNNNMQGMMRTMGMGKASEMMNSSSGMMGGSEAIEDMSMSQMMDTLSSKTGDDFDKEFIANMLVHHEGAVDMAQKAKESAKRSEVKDMAQDVIDAQSKEIEMMRGWYRDWYGKEVEDEHELHHK